MRKLFSFLVIISIISLSCKEQVTEKIIKEEGIAIPESKVIAAVTKGDTPKTASETMKSGLPEKMTKDLIRDINAHKISEEDKEYFIDQLKKSNNLIDGALIGGAVKKVEKTLRQKLIGKELQKKVIAKVKSELERGLNSKSQNLKMKIIMSFER